MRLALGSVLRGRVHPAHLLGRPHGVSRLPAAPREAGSAAEEVVYAAAVVALAGPRREHQQHARAVTARERVALVGLEARQRAAASASNDVPSPAVIWTAPSSDDDPCVLLHLMLAERLAGLSTIRTARAPSSEWSDDRIARPRRRVELEEIPALHRRRSVSPPGYTQTPSHATRRRHVRDGPVPQQLLRRAQRARRGRGGRDRPGDDPTPLRLELARMGARTGRHPRHAHRRRPHRRRRRARRGHGQRGVGAGRRGRGAADRRDARRAARRAARSGAHGDRRRRGHGRPGSRSRCSTCPATRPATSRSSPTASSSRATCCSRARSAGSTSPAATGRRCSTRCESLLDRLPPDTVVHPGHGPTTTLGRELQTNPFLRELRASAAVSSKFQAPRGTHDVLPADAAWWHVVSTMEEVAALYGWGRIQTPGLRGHRALRAHVGRGSDVVHKEMYIVHRPQRPLAHAAARGHGADRARVRRARPAPRAAAGEGVHDRADVPVRRARAAAATASTTSSPSRRSARPTRRSTPRSSSSTPSCCGVWA